MSPLYPQSPPCCTIAQNEFYTTLSVHRMYFLCSNIIFAMEQLLTRFTIFFCHIQMNPGQFIRSMLHISNAGFLSFLSTVCVKVIAYGDLCLYVSARAFESVPVLRWEYVFHWQHLYHDHELIVVSRCPPQVIQGYVIEQLRTHTHTHTHTHTRMHFQPYGPKRSPAALWVQATLFWSMFRLHRTSQHPSNFFSQHTFGWCFYTVLVPKRCHY